MKRTLEVMTALERQMHGRQPRPGALRATLPPVTGRWLQYRETGNGHGR